jgi:ATP-dependent DNA helicase RecQ
LWDPADIATREYLIDSPRRDAREHKTVDPGEVVRRKELEHRKLKRMIEYGDTSACLRATILRYFGDPAARERCDACGNCRPGAIDAYEHEMVRKILSGIARAGERYGRHRIVAMLLGATDDLPPSLTRLSTTGLLRHETSTAVRQWIDASIAAGLIVVSKDQYQILGLTPRGREAMQGRLQGLEICRPAAGTVRSARHRRRDNLDDWSGARMRRRRMWPASVDAFEFDVDIPRKFRRPEE